MNTLDSMQMCPDCGYAWSMKQLDLGEQYRVFCPKHDLYVARYCDGRPLLDDTCPQCKIEALEMSIELLKKLLPTPPGPSSPPNNEHFHRQRG